MEAERSVERERGEGEMSSEAGRDLKIQCALKMQKGAMSQGTEL